MNDLYYLEAAKKMGWGLLDFAVPPSEFARWYVFEMYRPQLLQSVRSYTGFSQWKSLNEVLRLDQRAIMEELESCLKQAEELTEDLTLEQQVAYISVNQYAYFIFDRLVMYVDAFWFEHKLNEEEDVYDLA